MNKRLLFLVLLFGFFTAGAQDTTLKEYVGTYIFAAGSPVPSADISLKDSLLTVNSVQGASDLVKRTKDTFTLVAYSGSVYFQRDAAGKVTGIKVEVQDTVFEGTKQGSTAWIRRRIEARLPEAATK